MKLISKPLLALSLALAGTQLAAVAPVAAQTTGPIVQGIGVANLDAIIANSNAFRTAQTQRQTTYKAQIDSAEARRQAIAAQLQPLVDRFNRDRQANANQASLQQQATAIQQIQASGEQEMQRLLQPLALSEAYVEEQIGDRLTTAVQNAMNKRKITLLLAPGTVLSANQAYNLNQPILDELNTLVPSVQVVPPQGWVPRDQREAQAAAAQQQGQQPAPPAGQQPVGR